MDANDLFFCDNYTSPPGKCVDMCPQEERKFREDNNLLHCLEIVDLNCLEIDSLKNLKLLKSKKTNSLKAVKQYKRCSAGDEMTNLVHIRSTGVLRKTVDYLLDDAMRLSVRLFKNSFTAFCQFYDFTFDRLRSVRQDIVIQRAHDENCLYIIEKCIEFYIYSHFVWKVFQSTKTKTELKSQNYFDSHINQAHLKECLNLLVAYYDSFNVHLWSKSRPLFEAIYLISNLQTNNIHRYLQLKQCSQTIFEHQLMKSVNLIISHFLHKNYIKCLRLVHSQSSSFPLFSFAFSITILPQIHLDLLKLICIGFRSPNSNIPLDTLSQWFCPSDNPQHQSQSIEFIEKFCKFQNIPVDSNSVNWESDDDASDKPNKILINQKFPVDQWKVPDDLHPIYWFKLCNSYQMFC